MSAVMFPMFLPDGTYVDKLIRVLVAITLFEAAYMAEVIRGGLQALPKGQYEAAKSLGMGYWRMHFLINAKIVENGLQKTILVVVVVDDKVALIAEKFRFHSENTSTA